MIWQLCLARALSKHESYSSQTRQLLPGYEMCKGSPGRGRPDRKTSIRIEGAFGSRLERIARKCSNRPPCRRALKSRISAGRADSLYLNPGFGEITDHFATIRCSACDGSAHERGERVQWAATIDWTAATRLHPSSGEWRVCWSIA